MLSSGRAGAVLVAELRRRLPHEDVIFLVDRAYAPYARRPQRVVADRVGRLTGELAAAGAKAVVLGSRTATLDVASGPGLPLRAIGLEPTLRRAVGRPGAGDVVLVAGDECLRAPSLLDDLRRASGRRPVAADLWPGLADLVEQGAPGTPALGRLVGERLAALLAAGTDVVALGCVHAAAAGPLLVAAAGGRLDVVDPVVSTVERVRGVLAVDGLLVRRRRAGWLRLLDSRPTASSPRPRPSRVRPGPASPAPLATDAGDD